MKRRLFSSLLFTVILIVLIGCSSGGGGGGDVDDDDGGGVGKGEDNVTVFWLGYGDPDTEFGEARSVRQTADGGFIMAGVLAPDFETPSDVYLAKTNGSGTVQWQKTFGGSDQEAGNCVLQTSDGGYIVGGLYKHNDGGSEVTEFYLMRTDSNGNALAGWPKTYPGASLEGINGLCEAPDGFVFVGSSSTQHFLMTKVDTDGSVLWEKTFTSTNIGWDVALSIDRSADGGYIIAGCDGGPTNYVWVARTDASGNLRTGWPRTYGQGCALSVKSTTDGGFVLAGKSTMSWQDGDAIIIKADSLGNQSWKKTYDGVRNDELYSVDITSDGGFIAVGGTQSYSPVYDPAQLYLTYDVLMVRVDASGNTLWQKVLGKSPDSVDFSKAGQSLSDGGFVMAGGSAAYPLLAKMDKSGNTVSLGSKELKLTISDTSGTIGLTNAPLIAGKGAGSLLLLREMGAFGLDLLLEILDEPAYEYCSTSGTSLIAPSPDTVAAGDSYTVTLTDCVTGSGDDEIEFDGSFGMDVDSLTGTLEAGGSYTIELGYSPIDLVFADDVGPTSIDGALAFRRQAAGSSLSERAVVSPSNPLSIDEDYVIQTISSCSLSITVAGSFALGAAGETMVFELEGIPGSLTLTVIAPVVGTDPESPASGELLIEADDRSSVTVTVILGDVELSIDSNGDDISDGTLTYTWDDLN